MTTLCYLVIRKSYDSEDEEIWVDVGYLTIFCVSGSCWGNILSECELFWVGGGRWGIILGGLDNWGWVAVSALFDNTRLWESRENHKKIGTIFDFSCGSI